MQISYPRAIVQRSAIRLAGEPEDCLYWPMKRWFLNIRYLFAIAVMILYSSAALAHPEDDLCDPEQLAIDPQLCAMLAQLNSAEGALTQDQQGIALSEIYASPSATDTLGRFVVIGVEHILPDGLDHILFVLAIFLAAAGVRALIWQISAFTLAHTITLGCAATGLVNVAPNIVEPVIAFTIAFVAAENLLLKNFTRWRPLLVFFFGLLHGLGFASFFSSLELPSGLFWNGLIGFNIGVELGQLSVVALAAVMVRVLFANPAAQIFYRRWVVPIGSALIGLSGLWWGIGRLITA